MTTLYILLNSCRATFINKSDFFLKATLLFDRIKPVLTKIFVIVYQFLEKFPWLRLFDRLHLFHSVDNLGFILNSELIKIYCPTKVN